MHVGIRVSPFLKEFFFLLEMPFCMVNDMLQPLVDFGCFCPFSVGTIKLADQRDEALVIRVDFRDACAHPFVPLRLLHYEGPTFLV